MLTRIVAIAGAVLSLVALGFALAQILPQDRHRLPHYEGPALANPPAPQVRDVTPPTSVPNITPAPAAPQAPLAQPAPVNPSPVAPKVPSKVAGFDSRAPKVEIISDLSQLDPRIVKMRERLIEAAKAGKIERLNVVFQMNETMPTFSRGSERDPVAFWKSVSGDGQGLEVLAILRNILELPAARIYSGTAQEMVVWPYLSQMPLESLTPEQQVDLFRLVTAQDVRDMKTLGQWAFWRLGIGKDGTVHYFVAGQ